MSWLAGNLLIASLLVAAVLLLRRPVASWFGARAAYALWLAPALRLILPPMPRLVAVHQATGDATDWVLETGRWASDAMPSSSSWWLIWGISFAGMVAVRLVAHHRFLGAAIAEGRPYQSPGIDIDVIATPAVDGPVATGLIHPLILVPQDFDDRFTPEQRHFALWHERLHHRRGDLWATAAALLVSSALWFNPLAWLALGAFRRDMESACDAALLTSAGRAAAPAYAETILRCAARPVPRLLCALTSIDELKGRLRLLNAKHGIAAKAAGLLLAGGLVVVGGLVAVPALADTPKTQTVEIRKTITDGKPGEAVDLEHGCPGQVIEIAADGAPGANRKEAAKIKLCLKAGASKAEIATHLEAVLADIAKNDDMDAGVKAAMTAKLQAEIAKLKAG